MSRFTDLFQEPTPAPAPPAPPAPPESLAPEPEVKVVADKKPVPKKKGFTLD